MPDTPPRYPWLASTRQSWKYNVDLVVGIYGFFAVMVALAFGLAAFIWPRFGYVSLVLVGLYLVGGCVEMFVMYYLIKCPRCGHNPTRTKEGKWASPRYLEGKFKKMGECPRCGLGALPPNGSL